MANQITKTLTKLKQSYLKPLYSLSRMNKYSHKSKLIEIDLDSSSSITPSPSPGLYQLEDAIHSIIVRRLQPDWLPFRPGSSFWVPPRRPVSDNLAHLFRNMGHAPLTNHPNLSLVSSHAWPSSSFFIHHEYPPMVEDHVYSQKSDNAPSSEDED